MPDIAAPSAPPTGAFPAPSPEAAIPQVQPTPAPFSTGGPEAPAPLPQPAAPEPASPPQATQTPEVPPVSPEDEVAFRQYIAELQEQSRRVQRQEEQQLLQEFAAKRAAALEQEHELTPEQAKAMADREASLAYRAYQTEQFRIGQRNAAFQIGEQYGVEPRYLMNLPTPEAMIHAAKLVTGTMSVQSHMQKLAAENEALKRRFAPPQTFANGQPSADGAGAEATWKAYGRGEIQWGPQVQQAGRTLGYL